MDMELMPVFMPVVMPVAARNLIAVAPLEVSPLIDGLFVADAQRGIRIRSRDTG